MRALVLWYGRNDDRQLLKRSGRREGKFARKRNPKTERRRENKSSEGCCYPSKNKYKIEQKGQQEKKRKEKKKKAASNNGKNRNPNIANKGRERLN